MPKLSNKSVEQLVPPNSGQQIVFDDTLKGFGVRLTAGSKVYIAQGRVKGKVCRVKIGKHGALNAEDARREAKRLLGLMELGTDPNSIKHQDRAQSVTLEEVFQSYKAQKRLRPKTVEIYNGAMRRCFADWQRLPVSEITKDMVVSKHRALSCANGPRGIGEAQANQAMRLLRSLLNYAADTYGTEGRGLLTENPVKRLSQLRLWNRNRRRQDVIKHQDLKRWYDAVMTLDNTTIRDYLLLCLFTGLRRSEAARLRWCNVDLRIGALLIPAEDAKNNEDHSLPLPDILLDILKKRESVRDVENPFVFPGEKPGAHLVESKWSIAKVSKRCSVQFSPHTLRRTFETIAESLDISHYALKRLLNHKTTSDVTAGYIVVGVERLRGPMQRIADFIKCHAKMEDHSGSSRLERA